MIQKFGGRPGHILKTGIAMAALIAAAQLAPPVAATSLISAAQAQTQGQGRGGGGAGMRGGGGGAGMPGGMGMGQGGQGGQRGVESQIYRGNQTAAPSADEESDRPAWAGVKGGKAGGGTKPGTAGTKKGDLYGDLYVILRDANGVPILDSQGRVQPLDASGNVIPYDPVTGELVNPTAVVTVEFSRLSVGKAPTKVLDRQYTEAINTLNAATSVTVDAAGRLVVTNPDGTTASIDSPLANLALYETLLANGYLPGLTASDSVLGSLTFLKQSADTTSQFTAADYKLAASLLGAAADKAGKITVDTVAYMDTFLKIGTLPSADGKTYVDFSSYTYDRASTYNSVMVTYLVKNADGTYSTVTNSAYDAVFNDTPTGTLENIAAFSTAADDARAVIQFIHDNSVPSGVSD